MRPRSWPSLPPVAGIVCVGALILLASWLALALIHIDDRYAVTGTSSVWMGLAHYAHHGVLFPPPFDGEHVAGTRYMPLPVVLHGGIADITGEYLFSGKLLGLLSGVGLGSLLVLALRKVGTTTWLALALTAVVLSSPVGLIATTGLRHEAIPTGFQLAAVLTVLSSDRRRSLALAALLCALAVMAKLTAITAPIAIGIWLVWRRPRDGAAFVAAFGVLTISLFAVVTAWSGGRIWTNLLELGSVGVGLSDALTIPTRFLAHLSAQQGLLLLVPIALLALAAGRRTGVGGRPSLPQLCLLVAVPLTLAIYTDRGSDYNHLLDLGVMMALVVGEATVRPTLSRSLGQNLAPVLAATLVVSMGVTFAVGPGIDVALAARHILGDQRAGMYDPTPLDGILRSDDEILSDTAYVPLSLGQQPIVLDPFMFNRIAEHHPEVVQAIAERVERQQFDAIVLQFPVDGMSFPAFFGPSDNGADVTAAISNRYRLELVVPGDDLSFTLKGSPLYVYVPNS